MFNLPPSQALKMSSDSLLTEIAHVCLADNMIPTMGAITTITSFSHADDFTRFPLTYMIPATIIGAGFGKLLEWLAPIPTRPYILTVLFGISIANMITSVRKRLN